MKEGRLAYHLCLVQLEGTRVIYLEIDKGEAGARKYLLGFA